MEGHAQHEPQQLVQRQGFLIVLSIQLLKRVLELVFDDTKKLILILVTFLKVLLYKKIHIE
jgi:hypothetical protein